MAAKLSLLDVLPRHERVDIGSGEIDVWGVCGEDLGKILARYPDAFAILLDSGATPQNMNPGLMGAFMAASQRNGSEESLLGNEIVERRCRSLGIGVQTKMLLAIGRSTFPDGIGPFLEDHLLLSSSAKQAMEVVVQVASREQATASPPTPKPSEQSETQASGS